MPGYFSILLDKSVLQGLSPREAEWLFHHYRVVVPPLLFAEVIGDLHKGDKNTSTGSGEGDARMLAKKMDGASIYLNEDADSIIVSELGGWKFPMDGRPLIASERIEMPDGTFGAFIDQTPLQRMMDRWREGKFDEMEREFAKLWRDRLGGIDLERIIRDNKEFRNKEIRTQSDVSDVVDKLLFAENSEFANLMRWMMIVGAPTKVRSSVIDRWKAEGRPRTQQFVKYTAYAARLKLYFHIAVAHGVVTTRKSNQIDMDYFLYLPFTKVFASSDKIHRENFDYFARSDQIFVGGDDLKKSLAQLADHYDGLDEEAKRNGSYTYADFPPVHMDNAITRSFDEVMPGWREGANLPQPPRDTSQDAKILAGLKPIMDAIKSRRQD